MEFQHGFHSAVQARARARGTPPARPSLPNPNLSKLQNSHHNECEKGMKINPKRVFTPNTPPAAAGGLARTQIRARARARLSRKE